MRRGRFEPRGRLLRVKAPKPSSAY